THTYTHTHTHTQPPTHTHTTHLILPLSLIPLAMKGVPISASDTFTLCLFPSQSCLFTWFMCCQSPFLLVHGREAPIGLSACQSVCFFSVCLCVCLLFLSLFLSLSCSHCPSLISSLLFSSLSPLLSLSPPLSLSL